MNQFDEKILDGIGRRLLQKKESIAIAESVTAGLLQFAVSSITDAAQFFQGGITAYNIAQKFRHLKVEPIHAQQVNCVSQQVAGEMALHVCELFGSNWGVAVTGYASPVPESGNKTFAYFSVSFNGAIKASGKLSSRKEKPADVQQEYAAAILKALHAAMTRSRTRSKAAAQKKQ